MWINHFRMGYYTVGKYKKDYMVVTERKKTMAYITNFYLCRECMVKGVEALKIVIYIRHYRDHFYDIHRSKTWNLRKFFYFLGFDGFVLLCA